MAEVLYTIPLSNVPQSFDIEMAGRSLTIYTKWNDSSKVWEFDLFDIDQNKYLFAGMGIVAGTDYLSQFKFLGIPGILAVYTDGGSDDNPTFDNLGSESNMYWLVEQ